MEGQVPAAKQARDSRDVPFRLKPPRPRGDIGGRNGNGQSQIERYRRALCHPGEKDHQGRLDGILCSRYPRMGLDGTACGRSLE